MKILLDTCTFLWIITDDPNLSTRARDIFVDPANEVYLSVVSTWEISVKYALGRQSLPETPERFIPDQRKRHDIESLKLDEESTFYLTRLPDLHKDPFDRMLICQAIVNRLDILTPDESIYKYPVRTVW
jgi:PIN domain nuclease of toxin-antitoxin system